MRKSKWPPERTAVLLRLVAEGLTRREIAERMGVMVHAVGTKLYSMGMKVALERTPPSGTAEVPDAARPNIQHLKRLAPFARFADVTAAEARAIAAGAPASGSYREVRFARSAAGSGHDYSLIGNAARLCAAV